MERASAAQRSVILNVEIRRYLDQGYRVQSATETTAQMVKPKKFSLLWALVWFLVVPFVGVVPYILYYLAKKDRLVYIEIDERGQTLIA